MGNCSRGVFGPLRAQHHNRRNYLAQKVDELLGKSQRIVRLQSLLSLVLQDAARYRFSGWIRGSGFRPFNDADTSPSVQDTPIIRASN